jgi:hypothetical protein
VRSQTEFGKKENSQGRSEREAHTSRHFFWLLTTFQRSSKSGRKKFAPWT